MVHLMVLEISTCK